MQINRSRANEQHNKKTEFCVNRCASNRGWYIFFINQCVRKKQHRRVHVVAVLLPILVKNVKLINAYYWTLPHFSNCLSLSLSYYAHFLLFVCVFSVFGKLKFFLPNETRFQIENAINKFQIANSMTWKCEPIDKNWHNALRAQQFIQFKYLGVFVINACGVCRLFACRLFSL